MWLINTSNYTLKEVDDSGGHPYAILSHTWGDDEVNFDDLREPRSSVKRAAWSKIEKTCELAPILKLRVCMD